MIRSLGSLVRDPQFPLILFRSAADIDLSCSGVLSRADVKPIMIYVWFSSKFYNEYVEVSNFCHLTNRCRVMKEFAVDANLMTYVVRSY